MGALNANERLLLRAMLCAGTSPPRDPQDQFSAEGTVSGLSECVAKIIALLEAKELVTQRPFESGPDLAPSTGGTLVSLTQEGINAAEESYDWSRDVLVYLASIDQS